VRACGEQQLGASARPGYCWGEPVCTRPASWRWYTLVKLSQALAAQCACMCMRTPPVHGRRHANLGHRLLLGVGVRLGAARRPRHDMRLSSRHRGGQGCNRLLMTQMMPSLSPLLSPSPPMAGARSSCLRPPACGSWLRSYWPSGFLFSGASYAVRCYAAGTLLSSRYIKPLLEINQQRCGAHCTSALGEV
jgi:hypothetical protein